MSDTPYGQDWWDEMMKWTKNNLVKLIKDLLIEKQTNPQNIIIRPCDDCVYNDTFKEENPNT